MNNLIKTTGLAILSCLIGSACTSIPAQLEGEYTSLTPKTTTEKDLQTAVRWAGVILETRPEDGHTWRVNFSRVHWLFDILADGYRKVPRESHPEDNWVWTPQDAIDMHRPEKFGYVTFRESPVA